MIKIKTQINKSATMRELRKKAEKIYKDSWQPELQIEAYMKGVEALLNLLHIPRVSSMLPDTEDGLKKICCAFFRYWWNAPGNNTEQGFDKWWNEQKQNND